MNAVTDPLDDLQDLLEYRFSRSDLLRRAVTHASAAKARCDYERLEFLGDRVLALVIAEHLLDRFPHEREGEIARRHVQLVRKEALAKIARKLSIGCFLFISKGEEEAGARKSDSILADVMEALIAALYLDGGLETARRFVLGHWDVLVEADQEPPRDSKTTLQEWAQGRRLALPAYTVVSKDGPPHEPEFTISVAVGDYPVRQGTGRSKRQAEQIAAARLLSDLEQG
ncbi:MAG: ribonuclease III [Rhodospirillaceae bacterium]|nr:ribonuclease III [Rhodospirillaceae bacterium]